MPKTDVPAAKRALVLNYFHTTRVAHTLKDLEKALPSAAGISSMVVKDYLASLVNDSLLTVEKIGSGNWYWSFPADAVLQKQNLVAAAKAERDKAAAALEAAERAVAEEQERLGDGGDGEDRMGLAARLAELEAERERVKAGIEALRGGAGAEVVMGEREKLRLRVNEIVDNIYQLEKFFKDRAPEQWAALKEQAGLEDEIDYIDS
ncbi:Mnd1-like protein [Sphaerosporella brunnea]|uniref:Mnd1-like protein n=1 Tax=Sphaerosporella brunnea TaxID=1250544 RepID=A0A5J5EEV3_9PEZI|nr:Mnd1-like protein [Sphaerosporella brunnea]